MNYFRLFNLPEEFEINQKLLSNNFYKLQLKFHPDLFVNDSESKKKIALEKSIKINKGYKILKNSVNRAIHLLSLNGFELNKETIFLKKNFSIQEFFFLYEDLDDLKKNNFNKKQVDCFLKNIEEKNKNYKKTIQIEFYKKNYENIITIIAKILFLKKIKINLEKEKNIFKKTNKGKVV